jgi:putative SOS response-associated peptidase YedK
MCGRARLSSDVSEIKIAFGIPPERPTPNFPPSWNVAPTDTLPVVRYDLKAGRRSLDMLRWGPDPSLGQRHQGRLREHQCQGRGDREQAGFP